MADIYGFTKHAGLILDQQDDPGAGWEVIREFWPDYLPAPSIGTDLQKEACLAHMTDGLSSSHRYPVDTPSNALASSMYFLAFGAGAMDDDDECMKLAQHLDDYLEVHDVAVPDDFVEALSYEEPEPGDVYADEARHLPVTTPEQTMMSITAFSNNMDRWNTEDQLRNSSSLMKAAEYHGIPKVQLPLSGTSLSPHANGSLVARQAMMEKIAGLDEPDIVAAYSEGLDEIREGLDYAEHYDDLVKLAGALEELDYEFGMDEIWGSEIPTPAESFVIGSRVDPFEDVDKHASVNWDEVDWSSVPLDENYVEAIRSDPEAVIPTLPVAERRIVEDVVYGKA